MLFNSYVFVGVFLPATLTLYLISNHFSRRLALSVLLAASLVFYGYWSQVYLLLLICSIIGNYLISKAMWNWHRFAVPLLVAGVALNLAIIGWFKYAYFVHANFFWFVGDTTFFANVVLPLGISFFTFQQIAYLVDVSRDRIRPPDVVTYALFVSLFPQLIAGPIVLFQNVAAQLQSTRSLDRLDRLRFQFGLTLFAIGLFKKVVVADSLAPFAQAAFQHAAQDGSSIGIADAWLGALAYTLQLYFDFSGYSDMAIGLSRMFGIRIPQNFNSPYKATSIIDFWRRWHMTLSAFFLRYVYIPLGGNRYGEGRQVFNIAIVFLLTGIWHGAGWTFIVWGTAHGLLVIANHMWNGYVAPNLSYPTRLNPPLRWISWLATMLAVIALWVVFRADDLPTAVKILWAMSGEGGVFTSIAFVGLGFGSPSDYAILLAVFLLLFAFTANAPNSYQITCKLWRWRPFSRRTEWSDALPASVFIGATLYMAIATMSKVQSEFLYFQF